MSGRAALASAAALAALVSALIGAGPAQAQAQAAPPTPLPPEALRELRGGFVSAGGVRFDFGVVVRSYVGDQLALETRLRWTADGVRSQSESYAVPGVSDLAAALSGLAGAGLDLSGLSGATGVAVLDGDGASALVHGLGDGGLRNLVFNTADGRSLRQETVVTLALPDLAAIQGAAGAASFRAALAADLSRAQIGSLRP